MKSTTYISTFTALPDAHQGAGTRALPEAVGRDMSIDQAPDAHLLYDAKQQRDTVDLFRVEENWRGGRLPRFSPWWDDKAHGWLITS
jgi:hypothetical protein